MVGLKIPNIVKPFETEKEKKLRSCEWVRLRSCLSGSACPARPARPAAAVYPRRSVCLFVVLAGRLGWCSGSRLQFGGGVWLKFSLQLFNSMNFNSSLRHHHPEGPRQGRASPSRPPTQTHMSSPCWAPWGRWSSACITAGPGAEPRARESWGWRPSHCRA